jgi:hypothetical protein
VTECEDTCRFNFANVSVFVPCIPLLQMIVKHNSNWTESTLIFTESPTTPLWYITVLERRSLVFWLHALVRPLQTTTVRAGSAISLVFWLHVRVRFLQTTTVRAGSAICGGCCLVADSYVSHDHDNWIKYEIRPRRDCFPFPFFPFDGIFVSFAFYYLYRSIPGFFFWSCLCSTPQLPCFSSPCFCFISDSSF